MAAKPQYAEALRSLRAIWIDAGNKDEYYLDFGAAAFRRCSGGRGRTGRPSLFRTVRGWTWGNRVPLPPRPRLAVQTASGDRTKIRISAPSQQHPMGVANDIEPTHPLARPASGVSSVLYTHRGRLTRTVRPQQAEDRTRTNTRIGRIRSRRRTKTLDRALSPKSR